jgi:hypothetical protein
VNLSVSPCNLAPDQLAWAKNVYPDTVGELKMRKTSTAFASLEADGFLYAQLMTCKLFQFYDGVVNRLVVWRTPGILNGESVQLRLWHYTEDAGFQQLDTGIEYQSTPIKPDAFKWRNMLYLLTGGEEYGYRIEAQVDAPFLKAVTLSSIWLTGDAESVKASVGAVYRGSGALAGFVDQPTMIRWLEVGDPDSLLDLAKAVFIRREDGGRIVAMAEVAIAGGATFVEPYFLIIKDNATYIASGLPPTSGTDGTLTVNRILWEGCVSKETLVQSEHGVIWCSGKNVWLVQPGQPTPIPIGRAIAEYLKKRGGASDLWHACYHDHTYILSVPASTSRDVSLNHTEQWRCDMRSFPEPRWWGPFDNESDSVISFTVDIGIEDLISGVVVQDIGQVFLEREDSAFLVDHGGMGLLVELYPEVEIRFPSVDFGDPGSRKIIPGVEIEAQIANHVQTEVQVLLNGNEGEVAEQDTTAFAESSTTAFVLDSSALDQHLLGDGFNLYVLQPPKGLRFLARATQPIIKAIFGPDGEAEFIGVQPFALRSLALRVRRLSSRTRRKGSVL